MNNRAMHSRAAGVCIRDPHQRVANSKPLNCLMELLKQLKLVHLKSHHEPPGPTLSALRILPPEVGLPAVQRHLCRSASRLLIMSRHVTLPASRGARGPGCSDHAQQVYGCKLSQCSLSAAAQCRQLGWRDTLMSSTASLSSVAESAITIPHRGQAIEALLLPLHQIKLKTEHGCWTRQAVGPLQLYIASKFCSRFMQAICLCPAA